MSWIKVAAQLAALGLSACAGIGPLVLGGHDHQPHGRTEQTSSFAPSARAPVAFSSPPLSPPALMAHIETLSSDAFEGRAPATPGEQLTIDYISNAFAAAGLQPGARDAQGALSWFQDVPIVTATLTNAPSLTVNGRDGARAYAFGEQEIVWTKRLEPRVAIENADLVFVGYGVVSPELGWNDYAGLDMAGKIAVILINDPDFDTGDDRGFRGRAMTYYGRWVYKFEEAARQGAAGALIIHQTQPAAYPWAVVQSSWSGEQVALPPNPALPNPVAVEGWVTETVARELFQRAGLDFDAERMRAQRPTFTPVRLGDLKASMTLETSIDHTSSRNVVGVLHGREAAVEAVLYTAHWDHLGRCPAVDGDDICNGAADNATGVAGLIELARRFANDGRVRRSIGFVAFTAEESGLLGSAYYAGHPGFAPANIAAAINMDGLNTVGPARDVVVVGYGQTDLQDTLARFAQGQSRTVIPEAFPERGSFYRSDHFNLAKIGVPVLYANSGLDLVDGGVERGRARSDEYVAQRYHKPADEIQPDWDLTGAARDLQLLHDVGREIAMGAAWPAWSQTSEFRSIREDSKAQRQ